MLSTATASVSERPGGDFNLLPYDSHAYPQSSPERLFALATLFGLTPPAVETATILELGCASGGNIIPTALRHPRAQIRGIDLAQRHVEEAQRRIQSLGLSNIEIEQGDVTSLDLPEQAFDCVIAHGLYSWVPPAARDAILGITGRCLRENGVAYVSYNVFPGWQMRSIIRDLMLFHAGEQGPPAQRIGKARWVIENVAKMTNADSSYGTMLRHEAAQLAKVKDSYILGEFLVPENAPCYFRDFNAAAESHGLVYLCESEVETCIPDTFGPEFATLVRTMSASQLVPLEQYIDFFAGRTFRQTLLVRKEQAAMILRQLEPKPARTLHFSCKLQFDAEASEEGKFQYRTPQGRTVTTASSAMRRVLKELAAAYPDTRTFTELLQSAATPDVSIDEKEEAAILDTLFQMIVAGIIRPSIVPIRTGKSTAQQLVAWAIARMDAAAGQAETANLRHETVTLDVVNRALLPYVDGAHSRATLRRKLLEAVQSKRIDMKDEKTGTPLVDGALDAAVAEHVDLALARLAEAALLQPEPGQEVEIA